MRGPGTLKSKFVRMLVRITRAVIPNLLSSFCQTHSLTCQHLTILLYAEPSYQNSDMHAIFVVGIWAALPYAS